MRAGNPWKAMRSRAKRNQRVKRCVVAEELEQLRIASRDVVGVARECRKPEGAGTAAEERPNERRNEAREIEGALESGALRLRADVVAVIEDDRAGVQVAHHRAHVFAATLKGPALIFVGIALRSSAASSSERPAGT